jgi:hypothetical protein
LIVLKGDIVRTKDGQVGEVFETWGVARDFIRIIIDGVKSPPMFASEVFEIIERPKQQKRKTSSSRERG